MSEFLKYVDTRVTFSEVPDEVALCINISNCPCHCKGCHSSYLAGDIGHNLSHGDLFDLLKQNTGISCVSIMGGDINPLAVQALFMNVKYNESCPIKNLKTCWYSGEDELPNFGIKGGKSYLNLEVFDYIKLGHYEEEYGPLNNPNTNQKFFKVNHKDDNYLEDITYKFWKK